MPRAKDMVDIPEDAKSGPSQPAPELRELSDQLAAGFEPFKPAQPDLHVTPVTPRRVHVQWHVVPAVEDPVMLRLFADQHAFDVSVDGKQGTAFVDLQTTPRHVHAELVRIDDGQLVVRSPTHSMPVDSLSPPSSERPDAEDPLFPPTAFSSPAEESSAREPELKPEFPLVFADPLKRSASIQLEAPRRLYPDQAASPFVQWVEGSPIPLVAPTTAAPQATASTAVVTHPFAPPSFHPPQTVTASAHGSHPWVVDPLPVMRAEDSLLGSSRHSVEGQRATDASLFATRSTSPDQPEPTGDAVSHTSSSSPIAVTGLSSTAWAPRGLELHMALHIYGRATPGSVLLIDQQQVLVGPDGTFSIHRPIPPGTLLVPPTVQEPQGSP